MAESKDRRDSFDDHYHHHHHHHQTDPSPHHQVPLYPSNTTYHQQVTMVAPEQVVAVSVAAKFTSGFSKITSICLGFLQIGICCLSIAAGILALIFGSSRAGEGSGFWCGAAYGFAGSLAIAAGFKPSNELIIVATVFSAVAIAFGATQLTLSIISMVDMVICGDNICVSGRAGAVIPSAASGTFGFWEMLFGLCLFIVGLRAICCSPRSETMAVQPLHTTALPPTIHGITTGPERSMYEELGQDQAMALPSCQPLNPYGDFKN